jgi:hypothetical protein
VLSEERRQWKRERALIEAEAQKTIAELKATIAESHRQPSGASQGAAGVR